MSPRSTLPVLVALFLLAFQLPAQSKPQQDAPDSDPTPAANPSRPTVTSAVHPPPPGYLQFEQGFLEADGSSGLKGQLSLVQNTKLALTHRSLVQVGSQPVAHTRYGPASTSSSASGSTNDTGDLILGGQFLVLDPHPLPNLHPALSIGYNRRVRTGSTPDLDTGSFSQGILLLVSGDLLGFHYISNALFNEQRDTSRLAPTRTVGRLQLGQTLSLAHPLVGHLSATGELWHFTQPLVFATRTGASSPRSNAVGLLGTLGYTVRPNLILDAGAEHGLTSTSTAWEGFAGFTYLLPHRLWPDRHPDRHPAH